jgi:hypothetical protein
MRILPAVGLVALHLASIAAQAPASPAPTATSPGAPAPTAQIERNDVGFSYGLPSDWEFVELPTAPKPVLPYPALAIATKGDACVELAFTAKHGDPASVVVIVALPFACYGQTMTVSDLPNFGEGAAEGLKQTFDVAEPSQTTYPLGGHTMWIERAKGTPKDHPGGQFTFEIACTVLEKGAACWMVMAADAAGLEAFEQGKVSLDGEALGALVPASVFPPNKPT